MDKIFLNENLMPGQLGHFFVITAFVASIVSCIAYFMAANQNENANWRKLGKISFSIHALSVFSVFTILFYIIFNHKYEYHYVWSHSNNELPFKYLLSCFWEGQEGSFLLWLIWHCVLGLIAMFTSGKWESGVMATVAFIQIFLTATILGIYFFDFRIGSSPFKLLRDAMQGAPIFQQENYLDFVKNGNGLNPLLQNYWMVIHPPILFLGFALTLFPFGFAIAGLLKRDFTNWTMPTLRWSVLGVAILGLGIMMGGAWAYESLSFGGYWAWDPVENASLVPWLLLVAATHTLLIYKSTGYSLKSTLLFFIITFFLIIYSTFLTRTGILGDTSVHAFTGEGGTLFEHLVIMLAVIAIGSTIIYQFARKKIQFPKKEEATASREFWMYIGALILLLSAVQITFTTSIPVWNKLFGLKLAPPANPMEHYNKVQVWIGILLALGTGCIQYLKYKNTNTKVFFKNNILLLIVTAIVTTSVCYFQNINMWLPIVFVFAGVYAVVANFYYLLKFNKLKIKNAGASIAHVGFGLMLLGVLISSFNKNVISINTMGMAFDLGKKTEKENEMESQENKILFRNMPVVMDKYIVTYKGDSTNPPNTYYKVQYEVRDSATNKITEKFTLYPNAQVNPKMGLITSPDTRRYWNKDVFTYITSTLDKSKLVDTFGYLTKEVKPGDSVFMDNCLAVYEGLQKNPINKYYTAQVGDIAVGAKLSVYNLDGKIADAMPIYLIRNMQQFRVEDSVKDALLSLNIEKINVEKSDQSITLAYKQPPADKDYITMKAIVFPYINLLLLGCIVTVLGSLIAFYNRLFSSNKN